MKSRGGGVSNNQSLTSSSAGGNNMKNVNSFRNDVEVFTGFKPAIEACYLDWDDYSLPGITYTSGASRLYHCPFTCFRHAGDSARAESLVVNQVCSFITILLHVFLKYNIASCALWSLTLREECRLRVFQNRILRRILGPKSEANG